MKLLYVLFALLPTALAVPAPQDAVNFCTCPPPTCPQEEPAGCQCRNKAILDCSDRKKAAGLPCPVPALAACPKEPNSENPAPPPPPPRKEKPPPAVKPNPNFKCPCEESVCIQSYPESCECANRNARDCYDNCGGPEPVYDNRCGFGDDTSPPSTDPEPKPEPQPEPNPGPDPFNTPGPVIPSDPLPPVENPPDDCTDITDHDERQQCKDDAKKRKEEEKARREEEKARRKAEKEERKRKKEEDDGAEEDKGGEEGKGEKDGEPCGDNPPCKEGEECVDIRFGEVGGGGETRKGCLPVKESEG
ncbi:hypothetical protein IWX49DRAFT_114619 [Phyllosticta citricarpa]|uniref:Uncharacterized protein n=1 Tax=Phyllosticta citricarpa TaxID=55181 RepID=A0ABR1MH07_9PEZI